MKLSIHYKARYSYAEKASFSPHFVRLLPRHDVFVTMDASHFDIADQGDIQYRHDLFDNPIAYCFFPEMMDRLVFTLDLALTIREKNPFHFLVAPHALRVPFAYLPEEAQVLAPFVAPRAATGPLPPQLLSSEQRPTVEALVTMCHWMNENIAYEHRETGDPFEPEMTLSNGRGSCRDFAVLFAEVLRANGIAARLASGFLWEDPSPESPVHSESQLHAWTEAYLPGAGWIGLDPTNGVFCDHHFLITAVGISPRDIAPISGYYYGNKNIPSTLETELVIKRSE